MTVARERKGKILMVRHGFSIGPGGTNGLKRNSSEGIYRSNWMSIEHDDRDRSSVNYRVCVESREEALVSQRGAQGGK